MANQQSAPTVGLPVVYEVKADNAVEVIHTGDTNETTLKSYTIPGGTLGNNGSIRIKATGKSYSAGGDKIFRLKLGGVVIATLTILAAEAEKYWTLFAACHNLSAANSQRWSCIWFSDLSIEMNERNIITSIDTSMSKILEITGQLTDEYDSVFDWEWTVEINLT